MDLPPKQESNECWKNAFDALKNYPKADYMEGWAVKRGDVLEIDPECENPSQWGYQRPIPDLHIIEHAWLNLGGKVIDPTFPTEIEKYCPGLRLDCPIAFCALSHTGGKVPLARYASDKLDYDEAYRLAHVYIGNIFQNRRKNECICHGFPLRRKRLE